MSDEIKKAGHYQLFEGYDASDVMSACMSVEQERGYWRGCVIKYAIRLGRKGTEEDAVKDAHKLAECALRLSKLYE